MIKKFYIAVVAALISASAMAQTDYKIIDSTYTRVELDDDSLYYDEFAYLDDYKFGDNWFVGGSVGVTHSMSENTRFGNFFSNERPDINIELGKFFYPQFGFRFRFGLHPQVGRVNWELAEAAENYYDAGYREISGRGYEDNYHFNIFSGYVDGLINLTNIFYKYKESRKFNLIGIIGLGYNYTFGFNKKKLDYWSTQGTTYTKPGQPDKHLSPYPFENTGGGNYFAAHAGLEGRWKMSDKWDILAEVTFNGTDDLYNGISYDRVYDTYFDVQVGARYHFKDSHGRRRFHYVKHLDQAVVERLSKMVDDENEKLNEANNMMPEIIDKINLSEALQTTISFYVDRYYITDAQKKNVKAVAKFLETHPDINLIVTGYADIETAYPAYNLRLSQKRAKVVYDMLVEEFNVPTNRLRIDYKGDTVQPYETVNEWNRAVIFFLDRDGGKSQVLQSEKTGIIIQK